MAGKSPRQFHTQWPNVSGPTELPNVSGATIQDSAVEVGDLCYSISDTEVYRCTTATVGSAVWAVCSGSGGTDPNAIHDNVAAEISAVTEKVTPVSADLLLIEDSADTNNKKRVQIGNLPTGTDSDAIHDNVSGEIAAVTAKAVPTTSDYLLIEDAAAANAKKSIIIGDIPSLGVDSNAIHDNVTGEINALTGKVSPVGADVLIIEDSAASFGKKKVSITNLPTGSDPNAIHDNVAGEIAAVTAKGSPTTADYILIEDAAAANAKKSITIGNLPAQAGIDSSAIHDNVAGEIAAVTEKATPVSADLVLIEDSADTNNKKRVQVGNLPGGGSALTVEEEGTPVDTDVTTLNFTGAGATASQTVAGEVEVNIPGTDSDAIHDNVSGEIAAIAAKATPTTSDYLVIEDAAATNAKKSITIGDIPSLGVDSNAIHDNVTGEINALTDKASPVGADVLIIEDSAASFGKKKVSITNLPTGSDPNAIHDNVAAEISVITQKATPVSGDLLLIEDSVDSNNKKRITVGSLPSGGGGGGETVAALDEPVTMGAAAVEVPIGQTTYDGSTGASHTFKAIVEPDSAVTCEIRLYDRGPVAGPATTAQLASKLTTSTAGLQVLSLTLTASASPSFPDNDQIYNTDRMYEIRAYISGALGDVFYVGKVTLA